MLGALAIISAILIVLADRERRSNTPVEQTLTDTVTPGAPVAPSGWTDQRVPASPGADVATVPAAALLTGAETAAAVAPDDKTAL